jgi:hypothetical protein
VFPLGFEIAEAGVSLEIAAGLQLDRLVTFTAEKGVVRGGTLFPLQKYARDEMIPPIPPVSGVDDFKQLGQLAVNAAAKFITASIDVVVQAFSNAINRIKSRHTAEIVFSGANETPFDPAVASFTYTAGPPSVSRPFVMRPESIAGPANVPHYGIGGFHQFLPQDHVFADPATLTVFYNDDEVAGVDESTLGIYRWNTARSDWDYLGGTPDPVANTVTTTVDRMGLYTVAAPMPAGTIALAAQWTAAGTTTEPHTVVTYTSGPLRLNTGQPAPDGTMFTVVGASPAAETTTFGTVVSADEDPQTPGVQVGARGGALQFTIDYPSDGGMALVVAASREGTALTASVTPVRP